MSEENSTAPATAAETPITPEESYEKGTEAKTSGNTFFKNKQYQEAYNAYTNAINMFISSGVEYKKLGTKPVELQQCLDQLSACYTNIALCFLKCDQNEQGIHFATNALKYDPKNSKALYLRGKMLRLEGELQQAKRDVQMCLMIQPENEEAQQELELIEKEIQDELQRRRALLEDDSDEESSDPSGMINPQVLRMLRSMNLGGGFNPMMFRGMGGMGGMKSSEEMYQEELEKAIKLSIAEEEERKKKEDEEKKKTEELQKQQDEMKAFFEEQERKRKEEIEKEQTPVEESIDEPFEVELDEEDEEEEEGEGEGEEEEEVEEEGAEGEEGDGEEFDIDEADLDNLEEYKPEEEQGQEAN